MMIRTFAWVRTQTGEPEFEYQSAAATPAALLTELIETRPGWAALAERQGEIRYAVNQAFVEADAPMEGAQEVAFFPPVTGG